MAFAKDCADRQFLHPRREDGRARWRRSSLYFPEHEYRARALMGSRTSLSVAVANSAILSGPMALACVSGTTVSTQTATLGCTGSADLHARPCQQLCALLPAAITRSTAKVNDDDLFSDNCNPFISELTRIDRHLGLYVQFRAVDDYPLLPIYSCPNCTFYRRTERGIDLWRRDIGQLQLWRRFTAIGRELAASLRIPRLDRQRRQWRAQFAVRPRQQSVVDNLYADLSVQDLLRPCGDFPRRNQQHDTRARVRPERHKHDADPRHARGGRLVRRGPPHDAEAAAATSGLSEKEAAPSTATISCLTRSISGSLSVSVSSSAAAVRSSSAAVAPQDRGSLLEGLVDEAAHGAVHGVGRIFAVVALLRHREILAGETAIGRGRRPRCRAPRAHAVAQHHGTGDVGGFGEIVRRRRSRSR